MKKNDLKSLNKEALENKKLISEINNLNKSIWRHPQFWTFLLVLVATFYSWQSGLFETRSKILELKTIQLDLKKDSLYQQIGSLQYQKIMIERKYDSLYVIVNNIEKEKAEIEKEFETWKLNKQSKSALKAEILNFVKRLRDLIRQDEIRDEQRRERYEKNKNWDEFTKYDNIMIRTYNNNYKTQAIIYREKLLFYLPKIKVEHNTLSDYQHPTNRIGLTYVTDNLEYIAYKLVENLFQP